MNTELNNFNWPKWNSTVQLQWATQYLIKRLPPALATQLVQSFDKSQWIRDFFSAPSDEKELLARKMKAAWSQKMHRSKRKLRGQKTHNLITSQETSAQLRTLANLAGVPLNEAFRQIVHDSHAVASTVQKRLESERLKQKKIVKRAFKARNAEQQIIESVLNALEEMARRAGLAEIQTMDAGLAKPTLDQQIRAAPHTQQLMKEAVHDIAPLLRLLNIRRIRNAES